METPLQFLRDLLPFSRPPGTARAVAEVREWLDSTADEPALPAIKTLAAEIVPSIARHANLHMRFKLLEEARAEVERALPAVERQVEEAELPLPLAAATAALTADNLLKVMAQAYLSIAHGAQQQRYGAGLNHLLESSIRRAMQSVCRRQRLAYRAYAAPSASSWQLLHELYRLARSRGLDARDGGETPIEHVYAGALLLAYVDPNKFPRGSLDQVRACTDQLATLAVITDATPEVRTHRTLVGQFIVPEGDGTPGRPLARTPATTPLLDALTVDFRPALAVLDRQLRQLPGEAPAFSVEAPETVLRALRVAIGGHATRRFARTRFKPRADLVTGIDNLVALLNGRALSRRADDPPPQGDGWPLPVSEWSLLDQSPDGFGIRFVKGEKSRIEAGEVVGLQPRENNRLHLCLVRRIARADHGRLELGLQEFAPEGIVIQLPAGKEGASRPAILIPQLPGHGNYPGILAKPGQLRAGQTINFRDPRQAVRLTVDRLLEASPHLELFALEHLPG